MIEGFSQSSLVCLPFFPPQVLLFLLVQLCYCSLKNTLYLLNLVTERVAGKLPPDSNAFLMLAVFD